MELRAGSRLKSTVCDTEVIAVKAPGGDVDIRCGGAPMAEANTEFEKGSIAEGLDAGTQMGKRYVDPDESLELLCTKPGGGTLALGDVAMELKEAKPLPASD